MKRWRKTILGTLVVLSGVGAAALTVLARRSGDWELTRLGALASIAFAVLIVIFVVPPLAKSARAEAAPRRGLFRRPRERKRALAYFMYLPHRAKVEQRVEQTFAGRGRVLVTGFEISTRFPFGFFRLRRLLRARDVEIVVYPKPEGLGDELHLLPIDAGQLEAQRRGAGHDLHSLREYQPHDDVRHIHWKATARQGRLVVREFTAQDERRVHVVLDTFVEDDAEALRRFERAVTEAASLLTHFVEERAEVRLSDGDDESRYGVGREHLYACLRRLALDAVARAEPDSLARRDFWQRVEPPTPEAGYVILVTTAPRGTIPADLWRKSHVIHM